MKESAQWVQLALKILGILESLLPAFLVSLNHRLKSRVMHLENKLAHAQYEKAREKVLSDLAAKPDESDHAVIDSFLDNKRGG